MQVFVLVATATCFVGVYFMQKCEKVEKGNKYPGHTDVHINGNVCALTFL